MSDTLTKAHIVEAVAEANGYTHKRSVETVEALLEIIKSTVSYQRKKDRIIAVMLSTFEGELKIMI